MVTLSRQHAKILAVVSIAVAGLWWALGPQVLGLWQIWTTDGLRSIGILVVPASVLLTLRAWRGFKFPGDQSWWGLVLVVLAMLAAQIATRSVLGFHVGPYTGAALNFLPIGLVLWAYVSGIVLLFAGTAAYRKALFPIALLLLVNPMPVFLQQMVDLRLQYVGALTARWFANELGTPLPQEQLKLMFSPSLGMFVAPGCNGLRGAVAMGLITLCLGHLRGLRPFAHSIFVVAGVLTAYVFNLVRLCSLVLCYRVALGVDYLAAHMVEADYVIGGLLFICAAIMLIRFPAYLEARFAR